MEKRTRDNGLKLLLERLRLDVRKNFSRRVVGHWSRLPREVIESLSSEMFKKHGGVVFRDVV